MTYNPYNSVFLDGISKQHIGGVAELADALDSKSSVLKDVWVRVPPPLLTLEMSEK